MIERSVITDALGPVVVDWRFSKEWNSKVKNHRELIRQDLVKTLGISEESLTKKLLDLKVLPMAPEVDISISHCPLIGGYAWAQSGYRIGLDIEMINRVRQEHVLMISTPNELEMARDPANLWVIKESAYKAFSKAHNVTVASDIDVQRITHSANGSQFTASVKAYPQNPGHGWFFRHEACVVALFFLKS